MSPVTRELRENGSLLKDLEYISEAEAAIELDIAEQTLIGFRKAGKGPPFTMIGRKFFYALPKIKQWVVDGGTAGAAASLSTGGKPAKKAAR